MDDAALKALLAEDGLAERDRVFTLAVMQGVARKRLAAELFDLMLVVLAGATLLWMLAPGVQALLQRVDLALVTPVAVGLLVALSVLVALLPQGLRRMTET